MSDVAPHDRERLAEEIFLAVADLPRDTWPKELAARCNGHESLAADVRELLNCHNEADAFLDAREIQAVSLNFGQLYGDLEDDLKPGVRLGGFQIERLLGRGGMGSVFVATQDRPRRSVALKVIRRGLATPSLLRRFEHEAEVLGRLLHPGIAQIYEASVAATGPNEIPRPYIAMELVDGPPLTTYAESHKLDTRQRMELIAKVCDAVHHAHLRGIIHRDLKPGNILVNETGQPKVLDFGVARAADSDLRVTTMQTSVGQLIGTLPYMSPEQVLADPNEVDTRSDVYALGVLLYQLLTGRLPLDLGSRSIPEAARLIKEELPTKLSHVSKVFRGEIDTIVSKALEKDKTRRYQSAADLGEDIRRHLRGEPIHARQDSAAYILKKQLRRYRYAVAVGLAFLLGLVMFAAYAAISARTERKLALEAKLAQHDAESAKEAADLAKTRLQDELVQASIERGRLEGALGNVALAEDVLWPAYLQDSESKTAYWALWELYSRYPCRWTAPGLFWPDSFAIAHSGALLAMGGRNKEVVLYSGANGSEVRRFSDLPSQATTLALAPDASALFIGCADGQQFVIRLAGAEARLPLPRQPKGVRLATFSQDGTRLATGGFDGRTQLFDAATLALTGSWDSHQEPMYVLTFSGSGAQLVTAGRDELASAKLWTVPGGELLKTVHYPAVGYTSVARFTLDDKHLLLGNGDRTLVSCDIDSGNCVTMPTTRTGVLSVLSPAPDGTQVFVGARNEIATIGSTATGYNLGTQRENAAAAEWTDAHTLLTIGRDGAIRSFDTTPTPAMRRINDFLSWCFSVAYAPDGKTLVVGAADRAVSIFDAAKLTQRTTLKPIEGDNRTRALQFTRDGKTLFAGSLDGTVRVIDPATGTIRDQLKQPKQEVYSVATDPSERLLTVAYQDAVVRTWDLAAHKVIATSPKLDRRVEGVAYSPDGTLMACSGLMEAIALLDPKTLAIIQKLPTTGMSWGVAFSPDGKTLLASTYAGTIEVYDVATRTRRTTIRGHATLIPAMAYSPDGKLFATGDELGAIKLWDASTLRQLVSFDPQIGEVVGITFDPSSRYLAAATGPRTVLVYDLHAVDDCIAGNMQYQKTLNRTGR